MARERAVLVRGEDALADENTVEITVTNRNKGIGRQVFFDALNRAVAVERGRTATAVVRESTAKLLSTQSEAGSPLEVKAVGKAAEPRPAEVQPAEPQAEAGTGEEEEDDTGTPRSRLKSKR